MERNKFMRDLEESSDPFDKQLLEAAKAGNIGNIAVEGGDLNTLISTIESAKSRGSKRTDAAFRNQLLKEVDYASRHAADVQRQALAPKRAETDANRGTATRRRAMLANFAKLGVRGPDAARALSGQESQEAVGLAGMQFGQLMQQRQMAEQKRQFDASLGMQQQQFDLQKRAQQQSSNPYAAALGVGVGALTGGIGSGLAKKWVG